MRLAFRAALAAILSAALASCLTAAEEEVTRRISNELELNYNNVSGAGAAQSTLTEKFNLIENIQLNQGVDAEKRSYWLNLGGRGTDDRTVDLRPLSLTNLQLKMGSGPNRWTLGDTFEFFSQYTLSSSLKGLAYTFDSDSDRIPAVTLIYGVGYPRWDSFYGPARVKSIRRQAYGVRAAQQLGDAWTFGLQLLQVDDSKRVNPTDPLYEGPVYGFDWQYKPFEGLMIAGESAFSNADESPGVGAAEISRNGSAHRIIFDGQGDNIRLNVEYERVSPGFITLLGSATSDRERVRARWRQRNGKNTTMNLGFIWFRDNLSDQKAFSTAHWRPEVGFAQRRLFNRVYASGDVAYRYDTSNGGGRKAKNHYFDLGYRDRFGTMDFETRAGLINYNTDPGIRDSNEYTLNATLGTRKTMGSVIYRPQLFLGTWLAKDDLTGFEDRVYETSVGLGLDFPESNISANVKLGTHRLLRDGGDDNDRLFANLGVYWRPPASLGMTDQTLYFRIAFNDYDNTDDSRDFTETTWAVGIRFDY
jgi:hypothetical protein